jgi:hypothetical protein
MTYRSDELHRRHPLRPFLAELDRSGRAERLELGRLGRRELAELQAHDRLGLRLVLDHGHVMAARSIQHR